MGKVLKVIFRIEEFICSTFFITIIGLVFASAVFRYLKIPIQWSIDITQILFAWVAFLGADIALRNGKLLGVDILTRKFSDVIQYYLKLFCNVLIIVVLFIFIVYGFNLSISSWQRSFQTLPISYSFVTLSLPVGSIFMLMSSFTNIYKNHINRKSMKKEVV
ncbi:TRAP transporter small permease [Petrocella sp. FN5]|uniref:TRAP transporter small permease n=1 Tax=Petrocella sp. FN5 TaxID=3032002 RepID=UPI0023D983A0|nr:TRAP transporter small permease [Petrocella sp. FN5]MDF1616858.1 TRAP transporter small permease [Petrocella sp. FN5]